ncbi:sodium:alanine symporter family protein [Ignatzschineria indica]|uniref:alanine/glycine:cation symporter family protein n=1 Tax=Ignatzschineria indica TaxID=472583 RepID=UPI002576057C|nr:sodium:alanine symporter family protein [Ignatzschineria indica]MDM1546072.1 sodium:alanine symporter family protein [Ignatzschineria indica]
MSFDTLLTAFQTILWDYLLVYLLCGTGILYTFLLKGIQVRKFKSALKTLIAKFSLSGKRADKKGMSSFQAVSTAIAGQVGTGNLAGPATAIIAGGPGALFWMWVSSFFGMATIYAEAILAQKYRTYDRTGQIVGGPAYYIEKGLGIKWLAILFAIFIILALGIIGNMVQSNSIASAFEKSLSIPTWITALVVSLLVAFVIIGGIRNIAAFTEKVVPSMAIFYLLGAIIVLGLNYQYIFPALKMIVIAAFNPEAVLGGGAGIAIQQAMRLGIARGLFSNEAGMGSTPHAHAVAKVKTPEEQGYIAMMGVFVVGIIVTLTGLVIITSGIRGWEASMSDNPSFLSFFDGHGTGITITQYAYEMVFGSIGGIFIAISLLFFAFSTIIGWYYYAETNVRYLFKSRAAVPIFQLIAVIGIFFAAFIHVDIVWQMADLFNGLMVLPNITALLLLAPIVVLETTGLTWHNIPLFGKLGKKKI